MTKFKNNQSVRFDITDKVFGWGKIKGMSVDIPNVTMWIIEINKNESSMLCNQNEFDCIVVPESLIDQNL